MRRSLPAPRGAGGTWSFARAVFAHRGLRVSFLCQQMFGVFRSAAIDPSQVRGTPSRALSWKSLEDPQAKTHVVRGKGRHSKDALEVQGCLCAARARRTRRRHIGQRDSPKAWRPTVVSRRQANSIPRRRATPRRCHARPPPSSGGIIRAPSDTVRDLPVTHACGRTVQDCRGARKPRGRPGACLRRAHREETLYRSPEVLTSCKPASCKHRYQVPIL